MDASHDFPIEGTDSVTLTCNKVTSDADIVKSYKWCKNGAEVVGHNAKTYNIGTYRTASGNYTCKAVTKWTGTSDESDSKDITFLCKYCVLLL